MIERDVGVCSFAVRNLKCADRIFRFLSRHDAAASHTDMHSLLHTCIHSG